MWKINRFRVGQNDMFVYYKIEGKNEFALFRANLDQVRQHLTTDSNWAANVMKLHGHVGFVVSMEKMRSTTVGSNVIEQGANYFVVRGTHQFFFRVEAVDANTTRIVPVGRVSGYEKFAIPLGLFMACVIPVIFTPFVFKMRKMVRKNNAQQHLEAFCKYLEMRQQEINGQIRGEVRR